MTFISGFTAPAQQTNTPFIITPRGNVLSSLKEGEQVSVKVIEKIDSENVLLLLKGTPVTAKNLGNARPGQKLSVMVQKSGSSIILRRSFDSAIKESSLKALVQFGLSRNLISKEILTSMADRPFDSRLAELFGKTVQLANELMPKVPNAKTIENLFSLFGLKGQQGAQQLLVEAGNRSLYASLRRLVKMPTAKIKAFLIKAGIENLDSVKELLQNASVMKRSIEVFRAVNALADRNGSPLVLPIPFGPPTDRRIAQLFWKEHNRENESGNKDRRFSVYLRMKFSTLGEVRALMIKGAGPISIQFFLEDHARKFIRSRLPELSEGLEKNGIGIKVAIRRFDDPKDPDIELKSYMADLSEWREGLSIRA